MQAGNSPMPGSVLRVLVEAGAEVTHGQPLLVLEAMKMEHAVKATRAGVIERVLVREGDSVDAGAVMVALAPVEAAPAAEA